MVMEPFGTPTPQFYTWKGYRCAYEVYPNIDSEASQNLPLLLIHPIGVGLSRRFWYRFCDRWQQQGYQNPIYNPDLLGCGESEMPRIAYHPKDWAEQLNEFLQTVIQRPVVVLVQGALLPTAIALVQLQQQQQTNLIKGLVLSGPPAWRVITDAGSPTQHRLLWNLFFDDPVGSLFWLYARRRQFVQSFSIRQLFAEAEAVDQQWLDLLEAGSTNSKSRYAVFSFLAGFWRKNYESEMGAIAQPTLVAIGEKASSISRKGISETPEQRAQAYQNGWPHAQARIIPGRNVLPYESTAEFIEIVAEFLHSLP
ncbi:alpha/beta hydrolase [Limnoraphis robusta CS-951]|uniref:Alpha/beta hydrolase n=2 Tax=Limnoraphis TaxID=1332112 RepID=A0A0F5YD24_9CYAN|nr:alpha/beta hydrolase [Limnoraphis robusta]KKD36819.1 alpha/beta hydrolase [Limnoraphis robusta CS-951]KMW70339.1 alpha/beta hydrolase [Limnoraphis robusta CS-951]